MKRSDLPLLISLDALLSELNVTKAATRLHISQPTLSGHLARLRDVFGDPLLVPSATGRGMVATERALGLRPRLTEALSVLRDAVAEPEKFDPTTSPRTYVVASNDSVFTILALDVLAEVLRQGNPALRMAVVPGSDFNLVDRMERGEVDLYLGDMEKMPDALKVRFLLSEDFVLAQRRGHPRGLGVPNLEEYCRLQHVVVSSRADFFTPVDEVLASLGSRRTVGAAVPSYNQVALVLVHTDAVASLPRRLLKRYIDYVDLMELPFCVPPFQLAMAWHPRAQEDPASIWLRNCFTKSNQAAAQSA